MNISKVQIVLQSKSDDDEVQRSSRLCMEATDDGLTLTVLGKTFPIKDHSKLRSWYVTLCQVECINYIILNVFDADDNIVYDSVNDLCDMTLLRKTAESNDNIANEEEDHWDYDTKMVFHWYYVNSILPFVVWVENTMETRKKTKEIEGLECPVLSEPLTVENARKFSKCSHWISEKALDGILRTKTTAEIKCPMCRQEHYRSDIESI
jgi:hypothetical protein